MNAQNKFPRHNVPIPGGRYIAGSITTIQDDGKYKRENPGYWFAVAVAKTQPGVDQALGAIYNVRNDYTHAAAVKQRADAWLSGTFKWKIWDGDTDEKWKGKEGATGCWIFGFGQTFEIRCCDINNVQIDGKLIEPGDYVDVAASVSINGLTDHNAGIYLNPDGVRFLGKGQRIQIGRSFNEMFADRPATLPPGAMAAPAAPANSGAPGGLPAPAMTPPPGAAPNTPPPGAVPPPASAGPGFAGNPTPPPSYAGAPAVPAAATPGAVPPTPAPGSPGTVSHTSVPGAVSPSNPPHVPPAQGFAAGAPAAPQPPAPPPAPTPTAAQVAAQYGVPHHVGWRYDPGTNQYVTDPTSV